MTMPLTQEQEQQVLKLTRPYPKTELPNVPVTVSKDLFPTHLIASPTLQLRASRASSLVTLPLELQQQIILVCDFTTLAALRLANYYLYSTISDLKEFAALTAHPLHPKDGEIPHASAVLKTLDEEGVLKYHSLKELYFAFTHGLCVFCADFAPYVMLLTCTRVCFPCLNTNTKARMVDAEMAKSAWDVTIHDLDYEVQRGQLRYWHRARANGKNPEASRRLYLAPDITKLAAEIQESWEKTMRSHRFPESFRTRERREQADNDNEEMEGPSHRAVMNRYRCMGAVAMLVLGDEGGFEGGVWCRGCKDRYDTGVSILTDQGIHHWPQLQEVLQFGERAMHKAWTKEEFLKTHFGVCSQVRWLWKQQV